MSDLQRRAWLRWIAGASLGAAGVSGFLSRALAKGDLPTTSGIHRLEGSAAVAVGRGSLEHKRVGECHGGRQ